ncbi:dihydropteroate synthase, partial [Candidatus Woesearchaeota archaeon]|nr:dihydropteroate synthase [Candidatus Woesearchaeota archaeon]
MKLRQRNFYSAKDAQKAFAEIGCDEAGIEIMREKACFYALEVADISLRAAIILKQEMMAIGGEVVVSREVMTLKPEKTTVILLGTQKQYTKLWQKLAQQPFGCKEIAFLLKEYLEQKKQEQQKEWKIGNKILCFEKPLIMGIINITQDSFSDGGKFLHAEAAIQHAKKLVKEGADILDLGAESTKPGSEEITEEEELKRLLPVLDVLLKDPEVQIPISIDTYKPNVAEICLQRGTHIVNDITGMQNPKMREVAAQYHVPVIIMHMQGTPKTMQENPQYNDVVEEIIDFLEQQINVCKAEGITQIMGDPGIGFGKTVEHNLEI